MCRVDPLRWSVLTDTRDQKSESLQDVDLLRYYAGEWDRYTTGANYLNRLFTYLNRYWVKRERDEGKKGVYQVYTVCLYRCTIPTHVDRLLARLGTMENILLCAYPTGQRQIDQCCPSANNPTTKWRVDRSRSRQEGRGFLCVSRPRQLRSQQGVSRCLSGTVRKCVPSSNRKLLQGRIGGVPR